MHPAEMVCQHVWLVAAQEEMRTGFSKAEKRVEDMEEIHGFTDLKWQKKQEIRSWIMMYFHIQRGDVSHRMPPNHFGSLILKELV